MSSSTSEKQQMPAPTPHQTMRGHTYRVTGVVHLRSERRIITCSDDGSLRLWDLESGAQIGEDWRDEDVQEMLSMALSPNGKTVASGSRDRTVRLWNVETRKVIAKWTGHTRVVCTLCWSSDGKRVASGSWDGTARIWDVKSDKTVLTIKTGHRWVYAVMYSPDNKKIATGGDEENGVKIWDSKTGKLITTLQHNYIVYSLAWTSDGKKLISSSYDLIRIFDTATWEQVAILDGHLNIDVISLSQNNRILASASRNKTARLWNLDTNLPIGEPLQHEDYVESAALSADGKTLVTGCRNGNVYTWDIHAVKKAGLQDLLSTGTDIAPKNRLEQQASQSNSGIERTPRSSLSGKSFLEADATRCHNEFGGHDDELPPRFFDNMEAEVHSSETGAHPHSSASTLLARLSSLLHRFRDAETTEHPQPSTPSGLHLQMLFARLSSLVHRSRLENDAASELQQPSTPSRSDTHALFARLSSFLPRSRLHTEEETEPHPTTHSGSRPDGLISHLSSLFRSQAHTNEDIELPQRPWRPRVVDVAPMRDREVLFVAQRSPPDRPNTQSNSNSIPGARPTYSLPVRMLAHLVLFLCCASPQHDGNAQPTQHQQQGQLHTQAPSLQTQPAAASTSTTPTAPDTHTTAPGATIAQPQPFPLRTRFVLFLCCATPPHVDGN
ncbi:quinon protein alcohol dehydrogenase-like superfamily [Suillus clintonianus]|uniref:quinon protein alcohol dehydrogenase-like superfamily n=1 Tax=Suillus clintonianus TaxID=1904413 RepID=UPI001B85FF63|nr:quinon protein alcohol dehydrogenase-like superfamily [Suillus clintonianus]KAG2125778.1 quinon protein alcohol dehydrogenase-like superfamily [Suillus clintonianus]